MMQSYREALAFIQDNGDDREDRTGVGTREVFGIQLRFADVSREFPLLTGKKVHWHSVLHELLWFLSGSTNVKDLQKNDVTIWDEWPDEHGELGPVYGSQWRTWGWGMYDNRRKDQIEILMEGLHENPESRRHIVSAWNVDDLDSMKLPPCHLLWQVHVSNDRCLDLMMTQRSADMFLGVPFNIASYAALMHILGEILGLYPRALTVNLGSAHIYRNHEKQVEELLRREWPDAPNLLVNADHEDPWDYTFEDFTLLNYHPLARIPAPVAV